MSAGDIFRVWATCPTDTRVMGGGYELLRAGEDGAASTPDDIPLSFVPVAARSFPATSTGQSCSGTLCRSWFVEFVALTGSVNIAPFEVYATCSAPASILQLEAPISDRPSSKD